MSDSKTPTTDDRQKEIEAWSKALARAEDLAIERKKEIQRIQTAIDRLRAWLTAIGNLADVDADERGWMVEYALAGKAAPDV